MKNTTLFLLVLFTGIIHAQIVNIPDPNFKLRLVNHTAFGGEQIDTNYDNEIQVTEAHAVMDLILGDAFLTNNQITDMTGIEAFTNITSLQCIVNQITSLDLSQNTVLEYLDCSTNNISFLDVSQCAVLKELHCWENNLSNIDISQNTILEVIRCYDNVLSSLDTNNNTILEKIYCGSNQLSEIEVSQNLALRYLICYGNNITSLDLEMNTLLERISCHDNQLLTLDLRNNNNVNITYFNSLNNPNLICIYVDDSEYSEANWINIDPTSTFVETEAECATDVTDENLWQKLTIYPNPNKGNITIENNTQIPNSNFQLTISNVLGKQFQKYDFLKTKINISNLPSGIYFLTLKSNYKVLTKKIIKL